MASPATPVAETQEVPRPLTPMQKQKRTSIANPSRNLGAGAPPIEVPKFECMPTAENTGKNLLRMPTSLASFRAKLQDKPKEQTSHNAKLVYYDHDKLLVWSSMFRLTGSALVQRPVLIMVGTVCCIVLVTGVFVATCIPDSRKLNTKRFGMFLTFLKFFISFMLGMYVQQSFKRWTQTVKNFQDYLIGIKQMIFLLRSVSVCNESQDTVMRQAIAASYMLNTELLNLQQLDFNGMKRMQHTLNWLNTAGLLERQESDKLMDVLAWKEESQSYGTLAVTCTVWAWIGQEMSQAKLGNDQPIAGPMQVRVLSSCQDCMGKIEMMKTGVMMQIPYMYAQLLSFLVYANNFLLAVTCGLTIGSTMHEVHYRHNQIQDKEHPASRHTSRIGELYESLQTAAVQIVIMLLEPMLYMAFLQIAHMLCYPFGEERYHIPTESFIARLHVELQVLLDACEWRKEHREALIKRRDSSEDVGGEDADAGVV